MKFPQQLFFLNLQTRKLFTFVSDLKKVILHLCLGGGEGSPPESALPHCLLVFFLRQLLPCPAGGYVELDRRAASTNLFLPSAALLMSPEGVRLLPIFGMYPPHLSEEYLVRILNFESYRWRASPAWAASWLHAADGGSCKRGEWFTQESIPKHEVALSLAGTLAPQITCCSFNKQINPLESKSRELNLQTIKINLPVKKQRANVKVMQRRIFAAPSGSFGSLRFSFCQCWKELDATPSPTSTSTQSNFL